MKTRKQILILFSALVLKTGLISAQEANWWHFGNRASIDFNSGPPVVGASNIYTAEGSASISNNAGQLQFYTDGVTVYDKNGATMGDNTPAHTPVTGANGLTGNSSSTSSAVIVPRPGSTTQYYVFTVGELGAAPVNFSLVDMALNGNLGYVTVKNSPMTGAVAGVNDCEKITVARHCNGTDYWVITHEYNSNKYKAYLVSAAGVAAPVVSAIGVNMNTTFLTPGYMKVSPNGRKLAAAVRNDGVYLYDFNPSTGVISNEVTINPADDRIFYGIEFSPSSQYLYYTSLTAGISRYDLNTGTNAVFYNNTATQPNYTAALQYAPDGNIYVARTTGQFISLNYLGRINNPNLATATYTDNALPMTAANSGLMGLPTFIPSFVKKPITISGPTKICQGTSTILSVTGGVNYTWSPATGLNTTAGATVSANPNATTTYTITSTDNFGCILQQNVTVTVNAVPTINITGNTPFCIGSPAMTLSATSSLPSTSFTWTPATNLSATTGSTVQVNPTTAGSITYTVTGTAASSPLCPNTATVNVVASNCCFASNDPQFPTQITSSVVYTGNKIFSGKIYVAPNVIITMDGGTLDLTEVDMVFGTCAGIKVINKGKLIAYNSVFRPCDEANSWLGIEFNTGSGIISESTFKNAQKAINLQGNSPVRIISNNFLNNQVAVYGMNGAQTAPISGNTITTDNIPVDYSGCGNALANGTIWGIYGYNKLYNDVISQNNFVNSDYTNTKYVNGIYLTNASNNANLTANRFTDNTLSIYVSGSAFVSMENNFMELTKNYKFQGTGSDIQLYCLNSASNLTIQGNEIRTASATVSNFGIYIAKCTLLDIKQNQIFDFKTGIYTENTSSVSINNNHVEATITGIEMKDPRAAKIGCNYIKCNGLSAGTYGIYWKQTSAIPTESKIKSNCVYNAKVAMSYNAGTATQTANTLPIIANNFLYNYEKIGVENVNFIGNIGSGLSGTAAGKNTFSSNNVAGGATDIVSNTALTSFGNYGITTVGANISTVGNNTFYSTAACGNQLGNALNNYNVDDLCDVTPIALAPAGLVENNGLVADLKTTLKAYPSSEKTTILVGLVNNLATANAYQELAKVETYVAASELTNEEKATVRFASYAKTGQIQLAKEQLARMTSDADLATIEQIKLENNTLNLSTEALARLNAIQNSSSIQAEYAREIMNCTEGGLPYRLEAQPIKTSTAVTGIRITEENLVIYPNPAKELITVRMTIPQNEAAELEVTNVTGQVLYAEQVTENYKEITVEVSNFKSGIYFVTLKQNGSLIQTAKLIKN